MLTNLRISASKLPVSVRDPWCFREPKANHSLDIQGLVFHAWRFQSVRRQLLVFVQELTGIRTWVAFLAFPSWSQCGCHTTRLPAFTHPPEEERRYRTSGRVFSSSTSLSSQKGASYLGAIWDFSFFFFLGNTEGLRTTPFGLPSL